EGYSPAILWFLDAIERHTGILVRPEGEIWFSGLAPTRLEHGAAAETVGYRRVIDGTEWELVADDALAEVHRDGEPAFSFPRGWRVVTDQAGAPTAVVGLATGRVAGQLTLPGGSMALDVAPNERVAIADGGAAGRTVVDFV